MTRTSGEYLASLKDGRTVLLDGERAEPVSEHPAFAPIATRIGELFEIVRSEPDLMQDGGVNRLFTVPRSREDLALRRQAIERWASHSHGWIGRGPDHVGSFLTAFAAHPEVFTGRDGQCADNVTAFHRRLLTEDLYVSYAIIPPQFSRATTAHAWEGDLIQVGVVDESPDGLVVRGAQMLATGGAVSDEILISCIKPLTPDDERFALSFVLPLNTPGMKLICRRAYAPSAPSGFDYPLTSRYDETDALVVFDDVLVPWDRVFVDRSVVGVRQQFFDTGAHVLGNWQAQIRLMVKLRFLAGLAYRVAQVNEVDKLPAVQERLGELASLAAGVESAVIASEHLAAPDSAGMWLPGARPLYAAMGLQAEVYPRALAILRDIVGGGVLQVPASTADLTSELTRADIERYIVSPSTSATDRIKLFKLAWDAIGSEFAGRHHQYEMFYAGAPFVARGYAFRNFDYAEAASRVDGFLGSYGVED